MVELDLLLTIFDRSKRYMRMCCTSAYIRVLAEVDKVPDTCDIMNGVRTHDLREKVALTNWH